MSSVMLRLSVVEVRVLLLWLRSAADSSWMDESIRMEHMRTAEEVQRQIKRQLPGMDEFVCQITQGEGFGDFL